MNTPLLAAHQGEGEADKEAAAAICQRLSQLTEDNGAAAKEPAVVPEKTAETPRAKPFGKAAGGKSGKKSGDKPKPEGGGDVVSLDSFRKKK